MAVHRYDAQFARLGPEQLADWAHADAAAVSDGLGRAQAMDGGIQPQSPNMRIVGQARTVRCMVGDNSALHAALTRTHPGDVLVVDAGGFLGNAVWGGLMTEAAMHKGLAGLGIDGAVRDRAEIAASGFPCFARGVVPAGPHKDFGGEIDGPIACGGGSVTPGDLVVADADGVTLIPLAQIKKVLPAYRALKQKEARALAALTDGGSLSELYGVPEIVQLERTG